MTRRDDLAARLARVHARIDAACAATGRESAEVTLVVVTKFFPASDVCLLHELGVREVGENRHQEARAKVAECAGTGVTDLRWHFIGGLQRNKAAAVAAYADVVESIDRDVLVPAVSRGAVAAGREVDCLVQVSLDPPGRAGRSGAPVEQVVPLADAVATAPMLRLRGVMGVAPFDGDPDAAFARLAEVAADVRARHPGAERVSAGMSGDLEQAISHGATHVRIGSAVLGPRPVIE